MAFSAEDWQKFGQVKARVADGVPVARACRDPDVLLERWKYYRMLKVGLKETEQTSK